MLGTCINYNGYGSSLDDLIFTPEDLYNKIKPYADPFDFINNEPAYQTLVNGYREDMANAKAVQAEYETDSHALFIIENEKWAKRVSGVFANQLAQENAATGSNHPIAAGSNSFLVLVFLYGVVSRQGQEPPGVEFWDVQ